MRTRWGLANVVTRDAPYSFRGTLSRRTLVLVSRTGHMARGLVYVLTGLFALLADLRMGGEIVDLRGLLVSLNLATIGRPLLVLLLVGFASYAIWRFIQFAADPENRQDGVRSSLRRLSLLAGAVTYTGLSLLTISILLGFVSNSRRDALRELAAAFILKPPGHILVAASGFAVMGVGLFLAYKALHVEVVDRCTTRKMHRGFEMILISAGRVGGAGRATLFFIIGYSLLAGAIHRNAGEVAGFSTVMWSLMIKPWGRPMLGAVAISLMSYGLYHLMLASSREVCPLPDRAE